MTTTQGNQEEMMKRGIRKEREKRAAVVIAQANSYKKDPKPFPMHQSIQERNPAFQSFRPKQGYKSNMWLVIWSPNATNWVSASLKPKEV
jgi:hypothetical protein